MLSKVKNYVQKYHMLETGDTVIAGVSGGADSVCLLFVLLELQKEIPFAIRVVHVHHGIREDADQDAAYVEKLCAQWQLPFTLVKADIRQLAREQRLSEEEAGRKVRYEAFERELQMVQNTVEQEQKEQEATGNRNTLQADGKIAVAHNSNDRAETMLFHLFRGTGLTGLTSIRPVNGHIIRPLLGIERSEIETFLWERQIPYCTDSTNSEDAYARNRIRHTILPFAEAEIATGAVGHMVAAADNLMEAEDYLAGQSRQAYERVVKKQTEEAYEAGKESRRETGKQKSVEIHLQVPALLQEEAYIQGRVILISIEQMMCGRKDITGIHVRDILELLSKNGSKQISLPGGLIVRKEYQELIFSRSSQESRKGNDGVFLELPVTIPGTVVIPGLGEAEITVFTREKTQIIPEKSYTKWFDYDKMTKNLMFRVRKPGDFLMINRNLDTKFLQDYMVNEKIPKTERNQMYLLAEESHILWIPGHRISEKYKVEDSTKKIMQVRIRGKEPSGEKGVIQNG